VVMEGRKRARREVVSVFFSFRKIDRRRRRTRKNKSPAPPPPPVLPDPVRHLERCLLVEVEHGVRAVVERVPGQRGRRHRRRSIDRRRGAIAARRSLATSFPVPYSSILLLLLLLRSRREAGEEQQRNQEQGWCATPHLSTWGWRRREPRNGPVFFSSFAPPLSRAERKK
jgi:hypothetical protein